ncbi:MULTISPECIES: caspase family protein [unclassified Janthinobacterium]|uniref:caspase family protein n=1 Tax=unclassified Janthinobacterium TaxID=2610881 RepID=UPI000C166086|nr:MULTISPECIES: caspase family protein [unclassified Janthinobacterium]MDO8069087.1 caspase family protein [Janthinobacterium sp. SUN206]PIF09634.1 caspase domain-containing protein [Janthinobacterium sp. 13]
MTNKAPKVRLLSVGISEYAPHRKDLPASLNDARKIYDTFEDVLGKSLDHRHSIVALDITGDQFLTHIRTALKEQKKDGPSSDLLIIYFSGHGSTYDEVLDLHFIDSKLGQDGISTIVIGEMLRIFQYPRVLLILDCCFSGAANKITYANTGFSKKKTTLIASSQPIQPSQSGEILSIFTQCLSNSLYKIKQQGLQISVANLEIELGNYVMPKQNPHILFPEGMHDLVIAPAPLSVPQSQKLQLDISDRLRVATEGVRESIWYALAEEPEYILLGVAKILFDDDKYTEPSWLVRRAAGSALSEIKFLKNEQLNLCNRLFSSNHWVNRCIGILTVRRDVSKDDFRLQLEKLLSSEEEVMDVRWLALLYLSDFYGYSSFEKIIQRFSLNNFYQSSWGVCELWERGVNVAENGGDISSTKERTEIFIGKLKQHTSSLINFIYLRYREVFNQLNDDLKAWLDSSLIGTIGIDCFGDTPTRGSTQKMGIGKWLHSSLYGSWRGAYSPLWVFNSLNAKELSEFIEAVKHVPIVAARMAIFEQLESSPELANRNAEALSWGVVDDHPWVRRVALRLFRTLNSNEPIEESKARLNSAGTILNEKIYPGSMDYLREIVHWASQLALPQEQIKLLLHVTLKEFSRNDLLALNQDSIFESHPYRFI